ncbi:MAG: cysteine desulfurase [Planctomycetota bacterium]|nr:MAG: cysteine desulfurase [Planctomycetota bacterium]
MTATSAAKAAMPRHVHLDNASTTWPKPAAVARAMQDWFERLGVDASRGGSPRRDEVRKKVRRLRSRLAELCGTPASLVILGSGATEMLNLAIQGLLADGDRVWCSSLEHNAVIRQLVRLRDEGRIQLRRIGTGRVEDRLLLEELSKEDAPKLLVLNHASNVTGELQEPISAIKALRQAGTRVILDCAQSAGRIELSRIPADAYVLPGHKALMGPPGVGALCLRQELGLRAWKLGGTGSGREEMPRGTPGGYEAGTPNSPGYLGWLAGIEWTLEQGQDALLAHERRLIAKLQGELAPLIEAGRVRICGGESSGLGIVNLFCDEFGSQELALLLDLK